MDDGWILAEDAQLLLWVPDEHRLTLRWPGERLVLGRTTLLIIDFSDARHGSDWAECMRHGFPSSEYLS
ncbi:hypothetical protein OF83DRAFT_1071171 [Amylostereum chailletii]|nr:hypothetical protein OF83DRAFT_1071171 [Amylostereum chailletii]